MILLVSQKDVNKEEPEQDDLYNGRHGRDHYADAQAAGRAHSHSDPGAFAQPRRFGCRRRRIRKGERHADLRAACAGEFFRS